MIRVKSNEIPILPVKDIINNESVAYGVGEPGILMQFMDHDECILIEWSDIVSFGLELIKKVPEEISAPTVVD